MSGTSTTPATTDDPVAALGVAGQGLSRVLSRPGTIGLDLSLELGDLRLQSGHGLQRRRHSANREVRAAG